MLLNGFDTLFYTLAFIVPGFVMQSTFSIFVPRKAEESQRSFLRFVYFSCINYSIWSWLIYLIIKTNFSKFHPIKTALIWSIIIFFSPIVLGLIAGYCSNKEVIRKCLQRMGLNPIHVIPSSWDYKFSKISKPTWVLVTLKDGSMIAGVFWSNSFASSDKDERDLYIEKIYKIPDEGPWQPISNNDGILINRDQIKHIEFWNDEQKEEER
jgi:hypothetical protein